MKRNLLIIGLSAIFVLCTASGWIFHFISNNETIDQSKSSALQVSFMKQYGNQAVIKEMIIPKIYEVAWVDDKGTNVSLNIGGIWVLIASQPNSTGGQ